MIRTLFTKLMPILMAVVSLLAGIGSFLNTARQHPLFTPITAAAALVLAAHVAPEAWLMAPLALGSLSEGRYAGEFLVSEQNGRLSRSQVTVTVPASTTLQPGYVLGKITASSKYVPYDNAASDGREVVAGILYNKLVNDALSGADQSATVIDFGAEVREADLVWLDEQNDKTAGLADLAARYIKVR